MTRFSKKTIIANIIRGIFIILWILLCLNISIIGDSEEKTIDLNIFLIADGIALLVGIIVVIFYSYLYYKSAGYTISNEEIKCQRGVIFKKTSIIKREKINAINTKQSLLYRILKIKQVLADSGSTNTAFRAEFFVVLDNNDADLLYQKIKIMKDTKDDINTDDSLEIKRRVSTVDYDYNFTSKGKFFYSFANILGIAISLLLLVIIAYFTLFIVKATKSFDSIWYIMLFIAAAWLFVTVLSAITSILATFFMYHDFKIKKGETSIDLSYGLFTKYDNSLEYSKIRGVTIHQNVISRLFGFATIYLNVVGYGEGNGGNSSNSENSSATPGILIPLCRLEDVNKYINDLIGEYDALPEEVKALSVIPYLTWSSLISTVIMFIPSLVLLFVGLFYNKKSFFGYIIVGVIYFLIELIILIRGILAKNTNGVSFSDDKISIYTGAFSKKIVVVFKKNIIGIEDVSTPLRRKNGIFTYIIHYHNNSAINTIKVRNVSKEAMDGLIKMININSIFIKNNMN